MVWIDRPLLQYNRLLRPGRGGITELESVHIAIYMYSDGADDDIHLSASHLATCKGPMYISRTSKWAGTPLPSRKLLW